MRVGAIILGGVLLCVGLGVEGQSGLPDLSVKSVRVSPGDLEEGQAALVRVIIVNQGQADVVDAFDVVVELDGTELATRSLFGLKKDKSSEIAIPWKALVGTHTLTVSVDAPFSRIRESTESNNKFSLRFTVLPVAGVRSFSLDVVKIFGRTFDEAGLALHFKLTDSVFTSLDNAVQAINNAAAALRNASVELELVRPNLLPAFDALYRDAAALVALGESIAESFERIAAMLSIGNFDAVLENAHLLRRHLVELSQKTIADSSFSPMQAAVKRFDTVIALAKELRDLLKGAQGRPQYQVAVELFHAFMAFGDELSASARSVVRSAEFRRARFFDGSEAINGAYSTKRPLVIEWASAMLMRLELYDLRSGDLVLVSEETGPWLELLNTSLPTGAYGYRLVGTTKQGTRRIEIGRLQVKQANGIPPMERQNAPVGMSGGH